MDNRIGGLVLLFVLIILGSLFASTIGDNTAEFDDVINTVNESIQFSSGSMILANTPVRDNGIAGSVITSGTILSNSTNATVSTDNYNVFANGSVILNTGASADLGADSLANLTYNHYSDVYINDGVTRSFTTTLLVLFFVIGVLMLTILYVKKYHPDIFDF